MCRGTGSLTARKQNGKEDEDLEGKKMQENPILANSNTSRQSNVNSFI